MAIAVWFPIFQSAQRLWKIKCGLPATIIKALQPVESGEIKRRIELLRLSDSVTAVNKLWNILVHEVRISEEILKDLVDAVSFSASPSLFLTKAFMLSLDGPELVEFSHSYPVMDIWGAITSPGDLMAMEKMTKPQRDALISFVKAYLEIEDFSNATASRLDEAFDSYVEKNLPDVAQRVNYIVQLRNMKARYKKSLQIIAKAVRLRKAVYKDGKPSFSSASYDSLSLAADPSLELSYLVAPPRMAYYEKVSRQIYGIYLK